MRLKNIILKYYYMFNTLLGSKARSDKINKENVKKIIKSKGKKELTILLHGVGATYYGAMYGVHRWFTRKGICVVSLGYDYKKSIKECSEDIGKGINLLMKKTKVKKINLIGISLGGTVARYYVERGGGKTKVNKLVTVFTPFKNVKNRTGIFLNRLVGGASEEYNKATEEIKNDFSIKNHLALYGKHDGIIGRQYPFKKLKQVIQIPVEGGHTLISYNLDAMEIVLNYLKGSDV